MNEHDKLLIDSTRFWAAVDKSGGPEACWLWTKSIFKQTGYGQVWFQSKIKTSHRVAWILTHGDPGKLKVLHRCPNGPNRTCCNPAHLAIGTDQDNADDREKDRNQARGEQMGSAKLTEEQVRTARQLYKEGRKISSLAKEFGVAHGTMGPAIHRRTWTHI